MKRRRKPARERRIRALWGLIAIVSAGAAIAAAVDERGQQRIAALFADPETTVVADFATRDEIADLTAELTRLRSETRLLALEREAMSIKIAQLESDLGPMTTGSIPDAVTAPARPPKAIEMTGTIPAGPVAGATRAAEPSSAVQEPVETQPDGSSADDTAEIAAGETGAPGASKPKSVRTINFGGVPLPKSRRDAVDTMASADPTGNANMLPGAPERNSEALADLAGPVARIVPSDVGKTHFAVQLGVADTMTDVREMWSSLTNKHDLYVGRLDPQVAITEDGEAIRLRLLAGPFANAADAIQLCTMLLERGVDCRAVRNEGQKLVMH